MYQAFCRPTSGTVVANMKAHWGACQSCRRTRILIAVNAVQIDFERVSGTVENNTSHMPLADGHDRLVDARNRLRRTVSANRRERHIASANIDPNNQRLGS